LCVRHIIKAGHASMSGSSAKSRFTPRHVRRRRRPSTG
jgi:hypothetical protein